MRIQVIPDHLKNPPTVKKSVFKVKKVLEYLEATSSTRNDQEKINISISKEYFDIISNTLSTILFILELLKIRGTGILIIRKVLNIFPKNKKNPKQRPNHEKDKKEDENIKKPMKMKLRIKAQKIPLLI